MTMTMVMGVATAQNIQKWDDTTNRPDPSEAFEKKEPTPKMVFLQISSGKNTSVQLLALNAAILLMRSGVERIRARGGRITYR